MSGRGKRGAGPGLTAAEVRLTQRRSVRRLRALLLLDQYRQKSRLFRSSVLLAPLGDDFRYTESSEWDVQFGNYQKLFDYFDQHPELHIKVRTRSRIEFPVASERMKML